MTKLSDTDAANGIDEIQLLNGGGQAPSANAAVIEAIQAADVIAFGSESFYTSIVPHLLVRDASLTQSSGPPALSSLWATSCCADRPSA
ncbi:2-phospho-L-lactate transferase CofD family protein [Rhizobium ruizarguesonis]